MAYSIDNKKDVTSLEEYRKLVAKYSGNGTYYRGQSGEYTTITPSIARDEVLSKNEANILHRAIALLPDVSCNSHELDTPMKMLSKLQHYGLPTRLIDVTIDPLIALFFAVNDTNDYSAGNVYVYTEQGYDLGEKRVKALSLLATMQDYDLERLCQKYNSLWEESITPQEYIKLVERNIFLKHSKELEFSNQRLANQKGTFVICSNVVKNGIIEHSFRSLDCIKPTMVIHIPYKHKKKIKKDLDELKINVVSVYHDIPSISLYIKDLYREENDLDETYVILKKDEKPIANVRRLSLVAVLTKSLKIESTKEVAFHIIDKHKQQYDVVWIYIAIDNDDYVMCNWLIQAQWVEPKIKFKPHILEIDYGNGYSLKQSTNWKELHKYYKMYVFDTDKTLLKSYENVYNTILFPYQELEEASKKRNINDFMDLVKKHQKTIRNADKEIGIYGFSKNEDFGTFLEKYKYAIIALDNLKYNIEKDTQNEMAWWYGVNKSLSLAKSNIDEIEKCRKQWKERLHLTDL